MKKFKIIWFLALILSLALIAGCSVNVQDYEDPQVRTYCETILDALIADDFQGAYAPFSGIYAESNFSGAYDQLREYLKGTQDYQLNLLSVHVNSSVTNGEKTKVIRSVYEMTHGDRRTIVNISLQDQAGIATFMLTPYEHTDYSATGTLGRMKGASPIQWLFLLLNAVSLGMAVYAMVDCVRRKMEKKVLWILVLAFGFFTVGTTISDSMFRMNFNLSWITAYSALIRYGSGTMVARLMLPVGAIAYFLSNRTKSREIEEPAETEQTETPE